MSDDAMQLQCLVIYCYPNYLNVLVTGNIGVRQPDIPVPDETQDGLNDQRSLVLSLPVKKVCAFKHQPEAGERMRLMRFISLG